MAEIQVERCGRDDFGPIVKLWAAWAEEMSKKNLHFPVRKDQSWIFQEHLSQLFLDIKNVIFVAREDGILVGFGMGQVYSRPKLMVFEKVGHVENLCTIGGPMHLEIKKLLFDAMEVWFREKGAQAMEISIYDPSAETLGAWAALGFKFVKAGCQKRL